MSGPDDERAKAVMRDWETLHADRSRLHAEWEEIATLLMANRKAFSTGGEAGLWQHRGVFNSVPVIAKNNLAAGLYGTATNPANRWLTLATPDEDLNQWHAAKAWLDTATRRVLASFRPATSNFYEAVMPLYGDIVMFGTGVQYDEAQEERGRILDKTLPLSEVAIAIDDHGDLTTLIRRFRLRPDDAARRYPDACPAKVIELAEKGDRTEIVFFHHVTANDDYAQGGLGPRGKRWRSLTVCEEGPAVVREAGYDEMPADAPRWDVDARETWGRGVGYFALPDVRVLNLATEANIRGAQRHVDPVTLAPDQRSLRREWRLYPGATLYGGMTMGGRPLVAEMSGPRGLPYGIELTQRMEENVKEMFGFSLLTVTNRSGMTPTEFLERQADRLRLMAPYLGRIQTEFLARKVGRRFSMLWKAGQLPPPPAELQGRPLDVRYTSAAALAQRSTEGAAVSQLLADIAPLAGLDPRYARRLDPDGVIETLAEARGAPAKALRSREDADALDRAEAQQAALMQAAEAAPGVARAARDMGAMQEGAA